MSLDILAWNLEDGLSQEDSAKHILECISRYDPDVATFPEAYREGDSRFAELVAEELEARKYRVTLQTYDDLDGRQDRHGLMGIVHEAVSTYAAAPIRIGGRMALKTLLFDTSTDDMPIHHYGVHLNDRSEVARQNEVDGLTTVLDPDIDAVVSGDLNSAYPEPMPSEKLRIAKTVHWLGQHGLFPVKDPETTANNMTRWQRFSPGRVGSIATRLTEMTSGRTLAELERFGFTDADLLRQPTMPSRNPLVQLDHIMTTPGLLVDNFRVEAHDPISDHRAIRGVLQPVEH